MRKAVVLWLVALAGVVAIAGVSAQAFLTPRVIEASTRGADLSGLRLAADDRVTPVSADGLAAGAPFDYRFTVTNTGHRPIRDVAIRSEKVLNPRARTGLNATGVTGEGCQAGVRVDCVIDEIAPGETRAYTVHAQASSERHKGDELRINTFLGHYITDSEGRTAFSLAGERRTTCGCFAKALGKASVDASRAS